MKLYQLMWDLLLHTFNLIIVGSPNDDVIQQFHKTFNVSGSGNEPQNKDLKLIQVVHEWHSGKRKFLTVSVKDIPNFYIRILDIKNFQNNDTNELVPNSLAAMSFYSRVRESSTGKLKTRKICDLTPKQDLDNVISAHLLKLAKPQFHLTSTNLLTLDEYLKEYEVVLISKNPKTARNKINIIRYHFKQFLAYPIDKIDLKLLILWKESHIRKLTTKQKQQSECPYDLAESTLKGAISSLRAALRSASASPFHNYKIPEEIIHTSELKFIPKNLVHKYYSQEERVEIYQKLFVRDRNKLVGKLGSCPFYDYLTPLILICIYLGLRPSYALKIKKTDIYWESNMLIIRGDKGKVKQPQYTPLCNGLDVIIKEWLQHPIHSSKSQWLFPNPIDHKSHLVDYSKLVKNFKKTLSFEHFDFTTVRHTSATHFQSGGHDIFKTQRFLGHGNVTTTLRYSHHTDLDIKRCYTQYSEMVDNEILQARALVAGTK